jgi:hypothetical protein
LFSPAQLAIIARNQPTVLQPAVSRQTARSVCRPAANAGTN